MAKIIGPTCVCQVVFSLPYPEVPLYVNTTPASAPIVEPPFFDVLVTRKVRVADGIWCFELRHAHGAALPRFTAGAHLTV